MVGVVLAIAAGCSSAPPVPEKMIPQSIVQPRLPGWACQARIQGWVDVQFNVNEDGSVTQVSVKGAQPAHVYENTAVDAVARWRYPPRKVPAMVRQRLQFDGKCSSGEVARAIMQCPYYYVGSGRPEEQPPMPTGWRNGDGLSRSLYSAQRTLMKHWEVFDGLRRQFLAVDPCFNGEVLLAIAVLPGGQVGDVRVLFNDANTPNLEGPLVAAVKSLDFGVVADAAPFYFQYPFIFSADDKLPTIPFPWRARGPGAAPPQLAQYLMILEKGIGPAVVYPPDGAQLKEEGTAYVLVKMARDGSLVNATIERSSGYADLDAEAVAVFNRVGKLPPAPPDLYPGAREIEYAVPIVFSLQGDGG